MPYCGHFGCGCCSRECSKCGEMKWHHDLEDGICKTCIAEETIHSLEVKVEKQKRIIERLCKAMRKQKENLLQLYS